jgi:DNA-directed RNA polymerase specialized sigma24 family protein
VDERDWLAQRFEEHRAHLRAVAYRMLGSLTEADDAVQGAWLRHSHAATSGVHDLRAWLTTLVARECLDLLRTRTARRSGRCGDRRCAGQGVDSWTRPTAGQELIGPELPTLTRTTRSVG